MFWSLCFTDFVLELTVRAEQVPDWIINNQWLQLTVWQFDNDSSYKNNDTSLKYILSFLYFIDEN